MVGSDESVDLHAVAWVKGVLPGVAVSLEAPGSSAATQSDAGVEASVTLYLLSLVANAAGSDPRAQTWQLGLRYLVTTTAQTREREHAQLCALAFAALEAASSGSELTVDLTAPTLELWRAFGAPPKPSFFLTWPLHKARSYKSVQRVQEPLVARLRDARPAGPGPHGQGAV